ncbi:MAG: ABC transporter substrate-binding protein, partial [Methylobacter sp.]
QKLVDVFSQFSIASYAHNFKDYSGESFVFDSEEETTRGGVVVHSHLVIPGDKPVKFDYMLKEKGNSWRIINIIANGVSDLALKRSEYTTILQREGFDALITKINEKIDNYSKQ